MQQKKLSLAILFALFLGPIGLFYVSKIIGVFFLSIIITLYLIIVWLGLDPDVLLFLIILAHPFTVLFSTLIVKKQESIMNEDFSDVIEKGYLSDAILQALILFFITLSIVVGFQLFFSNGLILSNYFPFHVFQLCLTILYIIWPEKSPTSSSFEHSGNEDE